MIYTCMTNIPTMCVSLILIAVIKRRCPPPPFNIELLECLYTHTNLCFHLVSFQIHVDVRKHGKD